MSIETDNSKKHVLVSNHARLLNIDALKGLVIILVVIGHVGGSFSRGNLYGDVYLIQHTESLVYLYFMSIFLYCPECRLL